MQLLDNQTLTLPIGIRFPTYQKLSEESVKFNNLTCWIKFRRFRFNLDYVAIEIFFDIYKSRQDRLDLDGLDWTNWLSLLIFIE